MNFVDAVKTVLTEKYMAFNGRASRSEFWFFVLFNFAVSIVLGQIVDRFIFIPLTNIALTSSLFSLAVLVPGVAVAIRRMHDKDLVGWWCLVPLYNIYLAATPGTPGPNQFGPEPVAVS